MKQVFLKALILYLVLAGGKASSDDVDFNRDIRPILSDKCFHCHGPDADNQDSDFRLDTLDQATEDLGGYAAIVPHQPEKSELINRVESTDPDMIMPPVDAPRHLTGTEKELLRRWIASGAAYDQHWAFKKPERPSIPAGQNPIDYLVRQRLEGTGLEPSPRAARRQLIRRVTLDLTGLPPTPEEVTDFVSDNSPIAYEKVIDRLLASSAYGERMAEVWLDVARYADTAGYQNDFKRTQWPWRDWVIDAYNKNMPFDRFSIEQLAGDLLPDATDQTRLATAFNRNHRINNEGGIIPAEFLIEYVADRVETTSTVWLGLTTGCARCHDHKYDPIKMKDYYSMFAFFHNLPEKGKDGSAAPQPSMDVYTGGTKEEHDRLKADVRQLSQSEAKYAEQNSGRFQLWLETERQAVRGEKQDSISGETILQLAFDYPEGKSFSNLALENRSLAIIQGREGFVSSLEYGKFGRAVNFKNAGHIRLGKLASPSFSSNQQISWSFFVKPMKDAVGAILSCQAGGKRKQGYQISLVPVEDESASKLAIAFQLVADESQGELLHVQTPALLKQGEKAFRHVTVVYDGAQSARGVSIFLDGRLQETEALSDNIQDAYVELKQDHLLGSGLSFAAIDELMIHTACLGPEEVARLADSSTEQLLLHQLACNKNQESFLEQKFFTEYDPHYSGLVVNLAKAKRELDAFEKNSITKVSIMEELEKPRETFALVRGDYTQPDTSEVLQPQTISSLPPMSAELPQNRLGLAIWLFNEDHPLTARVAVNRYWQMLFGTGLVKTPEDFGSQGAMPTHPKLLDWLAVEFHNSGWDIKCLLKRIVTSETYCQDSRTSKRALDVDPTNALLSRGARFRLSAFAIRDQALAASGLLSRQLGGAPVMPYQPAGLWDELSAKGFKYVEAKDDGLYRRSLYTFWRRTVPPPNMMNFDSASREACTVSLARTNTPLQAINLMNDPQFVEAARVLGERMLLESDADSPEKRITRASLLLLGREPSAEEMGIYLAAYNDYLAVFKADPGEAQKLVSVGKAAVDPNLDIVDWATCTAMASVFLNLDEAVTKE